MKIAAEKNTVSSTPKKGPFFQQGSGGMFSQNAGEPSFFEGHGMTPSVQTKCAHCEQEEKLQKKEDEFSAHEGVVQKRPIAAGPLDGEGSGPGSAGPSLESRLQASRNGGSALPASVQGSMGNALGADLGNVRVHTDEQAVQMNRELNARAFTHQNHIYFNSSNYDVNSQAGQHLLAHELTHTLQQGAVKENKPAESRGPGNAASAADPGAVASPRALLSHTGEAGRISRAPEGVIMKAALFSSTIDICRRVLESRTFTVSSSNLDVKINPRLSDPGNPDCKHHKFNVSLSEAIPLHFDDHAYDSANVDTSRPAYLEWVGLSPGRYYLTISRSYDNPNCCMEGTIEVSERTEEEKVKQEFCNKKRAAKEFPSQNGGVWDWNGTGHGGTYGPGPKLDGPFTVYQRDPGIPSGAKCRGACGPDCDTCKSDPKMFMQDPVSGEIWLYKNFQDCGAHDGCQEHDAAFDWAAAEHGEVGKGAVLMKWHMAANLECFCNYDLGTCKGWIGGAPPHQRRLYFADEAIKVGDSYVQNSCKEQHPGFIDCDADAADMYEVLVLWGMDNGYDNFRDFKPFRDFPKDEIAACSFGPGRTWHGKARNIKTKKTEIISIFDCYCCNEEGQSGSDFRGAHRSDINPDATGAGASSGPGATGAGPGMAGSRSGQAATGASGVKPGPGITAVGPVPAAADPAKQPSREVPLIDQGSYDECQELIREKEFSMALDIVMISMLAGKRLNPALFDIKYEGRADAGEGLTTTRYKLDPVSKNYVPNGPSTLTLYIPAFANVPWLVSSLMHEYQHVQQQQRERPPEELDPVKDGGRAEEFSEAGEVEAYLWEMENAKDSGVAPHPGSIRELFIRLTEHYNNLGKYNAARQATYRVRYEAAGKLVKPQTKEEAELEQCDQGKLPKKQCDNLYEKVRKKYGDKERDKNVDPDKDVDKSRIRRDDAPVADSFRVIYNRLDSWDIYIRRKHADWYEEFTGKYSLNRKRLEWLADLKADTVDYKANFRNIRKFDVEAERKKFQIETLAKIEGKIKALNLEIAIWYKGKSLDPDTPDMIIEKIHKEATELWREEWQGLILAVNRILSSLWPPARDRIIAWVNEQRKIHPGADLKGPVGNIEYVGSLATGMKGAPKQFARFNVNKFDVDANLVAPPLAKYAMNFDKIPPDRKRIFAVGQKTSITPLLDFCFDTHRTLSGVQGYDITEQFDVVIQAPELPTQKRNREGTERIYSIRENLMKKLGEKAGEARYNEMLKELSENGLMDPETNEQLRDDLEKEDALKLNTILKKYES